MPDNSNKLSHFWQELNCRKVVRVITVYATAEFVILELVDIISESLKLPMWFLPVVIVLLCIGFIIAISPFINLCDNPEKQYLGDGTYINNL